MSSIRFRSALATLAILSLALTAACKKDGGGGGAAAGEALSYLPKDATMVVGVNLGAAMNAKVFEKYRDELMAGMPDDLKTLKDTCGMDLTKDFKSAVIGFSGDVNEPSSVIVVINGNISKSKVEKCVASRAEKEPDSKVSLTTEGKLTALTNKRGEKKYAYWASDNTMIMDALSTSPDALNAVIAGGASVKDNADTMSAVKLANKGGVFWVAGKTPKMPGQVKMMVGDVGSFAVSVSAGDNVEAKITGSLKNADEATKAKQAITGLIAMGKGAPQAKDFASVIDSIKVSSEGSNVVLSISLSQADVDKLASMRGMMGMGR